MEHLDALFVATKEPLEEKDVVSYLNEMGINEGGIDKLSFDKQVKTKVIGDIVVYYPSVVPDGHQKQDTADEKLLGHLKQHLQAIKSKPTIEDMGARIREMSNKKDQMV
eukprot:Phypoly_transcript_18534.p1 GENE.Phypoly_transcript_18534~~Phypoly_transcript_18534.p1  ORF type:complete len:109 (+),score=17.64 Phypoly_transcript_18534:92-418(+)